jgi:hypothetical protein
MVWSAYEGGYTSMPFYTQVVVDMIDAANDNSNNGKTLVSEDNVTGNIITNRRCFSRSNKLDWMERQHKTHTQQCDRTELGCVI